jgi:hypothetical protein
MEDPADDTADFPDKDSANMLLLDKPTSRDSEPLIREDEKLQQVSIGPAQEPRTKYLTTTLLITAWLAMSFGLVLSNKYIMNTLDFAYPATLTCWHQICVIFITRAPRILNKLYTTSDCPQLTREEYCRTIVLPSALFALSLVCNNMPYLTLSVSFIQMLKGLGPAVSLLAMWSLSLQNLDFATCRNIGLVVIGAVISSFGELKFHMGGFLYQMLGLLFDGYRLGLTRKLLSSDKRLEPVQAMKLMAPPSACMLGVIAAVSEWPSISRDDFSRVGPSILLANGLQGCLLNLVVFALVSVFELRRYCFPEG